MTERTERRIAGFAAGLLLLVLCGWALRAALARADTLIWPFFHDAWRDVGAAQGMLDGRYPEDPVVLGAVLWYNPLTGALNALYAWATGLSAGAANVAAGPWVNLLIPLGLFLLVRVAVGAWAAAGALLMLVAGNALHERMGVWVGTVTYSPWLWAPPLGQALLFFSLALFVLELRRPSIARQVALGVAWGLTFMAHTSPAVVFGLVYVAVRLWIAYRPCGPYGEKHRLRAFALPMAVAFVSSLPYTGPILWHYQFRMKNPLPTKYVDAVMAVEQLPNLLLSACSVSTLIALWGLVWVWRARRDNPAARVLLLWTGVVWALLAQFYLGLLLNSLTGWNLPQLVPGHHHLMGLGGIKAALFGIGLYALAASLVPRIPAARVAGQVVALAISAALLLPAYAKVLDFFTPHDFGWHTTSFDDRRKCVDWIVANCPPDAVFLCDEQHSIRLVLPSGRKAVQNLDIFSNPYMPYEPRVQAKSALYRALRNRDWDAFHAEAAPYHVSHLLALDAALLQDNNGADRLSVEEITQLAPPGMRLVYHEDGIGIFELEISSAIEF